jgi:hypothetical protein
MVSPTDHTFESSSEQKIISKGITNRYHRLNVSAAAENVVLATKATMVDEESTDPIWTSSGTLKFSIFLYLINFICKLDDGTSKSLPITDFYPDSYSSSSSISSYDFHSSNNNSDHINQPSSSGYDSSLTSIPDHLFPSSSNAIPIPDCHLVEQFVHLHLDDRNSSPPSSISSLSSQEPTSTINSPSYCRKCLQNNQLSSDTDDDSQSTTISTNFLSSQKRPRSLPIAIQQPKTVINEDETDNDSSFCPYTNGLKLHINEQTKINQKNSLEHFIMSPTDKVKIQMKYQENDTRNELKISQPEDIDFKRSKLKAIRVLYQNRILLNSIQSPVGQQVRKYHFLKFQFRFLHLRNQQYFHREQQDIVILH